MRLIILQITFWVSAMTGSLFFVHMLQLESYQTRGYWRWLKEKADSAGARMLPAFLVVVLSVFFREDWTLWAAITLFTLSMLFAFPRRKAKKPLKFTSRVVRLLAAQALLLGAASFTLRLPLEEPELLLILAFCFILLPFILLLANLCTLPVQKAVNRYYIRDAQKKLRAHPDLLIIGITGSYGKTSVKNILQRLLSVHYSTFATPESYNTPMGIVRSVREGLNATHEIFLCEMGARHVGDIRECCGIVRPHHGVITSIGPMHLETFKTMENIVKTKFELAAALPSDGKTFINYSGKDARSGKAKNPVGFALNPGQGVSVWAEDIRWGRDGTFFTAVTEDGRRQEYHTMLLGRHQITNILAAVAVCDSLRIPLGRLCGAVRALQPVPHRLHLIPGGLFNIIDDAFNSNPAGAAAALEVLDEFDGVKILVTPGMIELGERQNELNKAFGVQAASVCDYVALVGEKQTEPILQGLRDKAFPAECVRVFSGFEDAMAWVRGLTGEKPVFVLLENDLPDNY